VRGSSPPSRHATRAGAAFVRAQEICDEDVAINRAIGAAGLPLIRTIAARKKKPDETGQLCSPIANAGWLATVDVGTATAPIYAAHECGCCRACFGSTKPGHENQGRESHTAWELLNHGVPHTVIVDKRRAVT